METTIKIAIRTLAVLLFMPTAVWAAGDCTDFKQMPRVVASVPGGTVQATALSGDGQIAYLALGGQGVRAVDVSQPAAPAVLATISSDADAYDVAVAGEIVVAAVRAAGVQIYDFSDAANPVSLATLDLPAECFYLAAAGSLVFATDYDTFRVIDISDPANPVLTGSLPLFYGNAGMCAVGNLVYVASGPEGLAIVDVSDPAAPTLVSSLPINPWVADVKVTGGYAFVSHWNDGLYIVDVSDPANPALVGTLDHIDVGNNAGGLVEHFDYVYLATDDGLQIIDVLDKTQPTLINKVGGLQINAVAFHDDHVLAGLDYVGLKVIDVSHPDLTSRTAIHTTPGFTANHMLVRDGLGYICYGGSGVQIVDLSDPDNPVQIGDLETPNSAVEMAFYGSDMAVVTDLSNAMHVVDISDPANPAILGSLPLWDIPRGLAVSETAQQAYISINWGGVMIIDISDPTAPLELFETMDMWMPDQIVADYPLIYVSDGEYGFQVLDVSDASNPVRLGTVEGYGPGLAIDFAAQVAYMAGEGFLAVDISDPENLEVLADVPVLGNSVNDIVLEGDMAYVAGATSGLHALDIRDRANPVHVGTAFTAGEGRGVAAGAGRVYLTAHFGQLEIHQPHCLGVSAVDEVPVPAAGELTAYPNPFNPRTVISFSLEKAGPVNLSIYDLRGNRVRTLLHSRQPAGPGEVTWDGFDQRGRSVAAGIYLAVLSSEFGQQTTKLALVR